MANMILKTLKNLFRVGTVSSINYPAGKVRVLLEDKDNIVTDEIPMLSYEYEMPAPGEKVLCLFLGNGISRGLCLGRYWYQKDRPPEFGKDIYHKRFMRDATLKYDRASKTMTLTVDNLVVNGDITVNGNLQVNGSIAASGSIIDGGGNTNHHSHP
jgi:phage baseplate assembly protein gpV